MLTLADFKYREYVKVNNPGRYRYHGEYGMVVKFYPEHGTMEVNLPNNFGWVEFSPDDLIKCFNPEIKVGTRVRLKAAFIKHYSNTGLMTVSEVDDLGRLRATDSMGYGNCSENMDHYEIIP